MILLKKSRMNCYDKVPFSFGEGLGMRKKTGKVNLRLYLNTHLALES